MYCKFDELAKLECKFDELDKLRMSSISWISCIVSSMSWLSCTVSRGTKVEKMLTLAPERYTAGICMAAKVIQWCI